MDQFEIWRKAKICKDCPWNLLQYSPNEGRPCDVNQEPIECEYITILNNMN